MAIMYPSRVLRSRPIGLPSTATLHPGRFCMTSCQGRGARSRRRPFAATMRTARSGSAPGPRRVLPRRLCWRRRFPGARASCRATWPPAVGAGALADHAAFPLGQCRVDVFRQNRQFINFTPPYTYSHTLQHTSASPHILQYSVFPTKHYVFRRHFFCATLWNANAPASRKASAFLQTERISDRKAMARIVPSPPIARRVRGGPVVIIRRRTPSTDSEICANANCPDRDVGSFPASTIRPSVPKRWNSTGACPPRLGFLAHGNEVIEEGD